MLINLFLFTLWFANVGGKWGATYIDDKFEKLLAELFIQNLRNIFKMTDGKQPYQKLLEEFARLKHSFYANWKETEMKNYINILLPNSFVQNVISEMFPENENATASNIEIRKSILLKRKLSGKRV